MSLLPVLVCFAALSTAAAAQTALAQKTAPAQHSDESRTCQPAPGKPCTPAAPAPASEKFPYPGEAASSKPDGPAPPPAAPAPQTPNAEKKFPYPGDPSAPSGESSSSSSGGESTSSSSRGLDGDPPDSDAPWLKGSKRRKLPKPERLQSDEDREAEDLTVAKFYRQSGDLQAAYLRAKDAVKIQADDPEAHFMLAEIAQRLRKRDEATQEYQAYLKLEPDGDRVKAASKALAALK